MKHISLFCIIFLFTGILSAQSKLSKLELLELSKNEQELYKRIIKSDSLRDIRVSNFLNRNESYGNYKKVKGKTFVLYDIIEGKPIYRSTDNTQAAAVTGTSHLQVGGSLGLDLDGSGLTVGVWDGGPIQDTHAEFLDNSSSFSRIMIMESSRTDGTMGFSTHGTHVGGTIGARGASSTAKGMATNVSIKSYNFNDDEAEMLVALADTSNPMYLSNHSYGISVEQGDGTLDAWFMGAYTQGAREIDDIARTYPKYLIVASAGNSGNTYYQGGLYDDSDKLTSDKTAKNSLVIANANPVIIDPFTNEFSLQINSSSSQGPTDDIRIKPDIAGDGTNLRSTFPNDGYGILSGTSMAAPNVTGSLALLQQYYNQLNGDYMNASTLKGLVCHTAFDDPDISGPDHIFGWGLLNSKDAAELITGKNNGTTIIDELTLNNNEVYSFNFTAQAGNKLKASISWTDIPGVAVSGESNLNNQSPRLINDLDIRLVKDGVTYFPWKLNYNSSSGFSNSKEDNNVDNIEIIEIDAPTSGLYTLTVSHKGSLVAATAADPLEQNYSLIVSGNNITLGVDDISWSKSVSLFPNPSNSTFTVSFQPSLRNTNNDVKVMIYDMRGRIVYKKDFPNTASIFRQEIKLNDIKSGIYMVNISEGTRNTSKKLIIK